MTLQLQPPTFKGLRLVMCYSNDLKRRFFRLTYFTFTGKYMRIRITLNIKAKSPAISTA